MEDNKMLFRTWKDVLPPRALATDFVEALRHGQWTLAFVHNVFLGTYIFKRKQYRRWCYEVAFAVVHDRDAPPERVTFVFRYDDQIRRIHYPDSDKADELRRAYMANEANKLQDQTDRARRAIAEAEEDLGPMTKGEKINLLLDQLPELRSCDAARTILALLEA